MNNYELGQSHARDLQVLLHGQANASSSPPPEVTRDGPLQTNRTEPPMVMMTSLPDRVQLPLNGNEPQSPQPPTTPSVEIWEESMISPSPEDEPPIPVTPHRDQTPNKKEPPHRPHARPSSPTPKPKRWIPRHAVEMEYKSLRKTLSSMAVEAGKKGPGTVQGRKAAISLPPRGANGNAVYKVFPFRRHTICSASEQNEEPGIRVSGSFPFGNFRGRLIY